ncbi:MAG: hypothetical protein AB1595_06850 [bacterium]
MFKILMWVFQKDGVKHVFIGDTVALNCHCFFRDGYIFEWQQILERIQKEFDKSTLFIASSPFHIFDDTTPSLT